MPQGVYRRVVLIGNTAVKLPRVPNLIGGMRSNRWEREMWRVWRPVFGWQTLCPVVFSDPLGLFVVMPRAQQPVTRADVDSLPDYYPGTTAEQKPEDYGRIGTATLALDYGLWDSDAVKERRAYYESMRSRQDA
jgi:hypothetical protein